MIPEDDRGFTLGDGLFETLLAKAGRPILLDAHLARMIAGAEALGLPPPDPEAARGLVMGALAQAPARAAVRVTYSAGAGGRGLDRPAPPAPRMVVAVHPSERPGGAVSVATVSVRRNPTSPASRHKTLSYLDNVAARREARAAGAEEALMLDIAGRPASAAAANLFWVLAGRLETPSLDCGILPGVMRAQVIAAARAMGAPVAEVEASTARLQQASGLFLTNSLIGVRPVGTLDGRGVASNDLVARLAAAVAEVA